MPSSPDSYSVYYHRDFDGVASAALAMAFVRRKVGGHLRALHPVDYGAPWTERSLERPAIVVDFAYHRDAEFWWDHHATTFPRGLLRRWCARRRVRRDPRTHWDPTAPSCALLMRQTLPEPLISPAYSDLVDWATIIDSAAYSSPAQITAAREAALQLNLTLAGADDDYFNRVAIAAFEKGLGCVEDNEIQTRIASSRTRLARELKEFAGCLLVENSVAVADLSSLENEHLHTRYAAFNSEPNVAYSVTCYRRGRRFKITCMRNPWRDFASLHLGTLCSKYRGGGHQRVGSIIFPSQTAAHKALDEITLELQGHAATLDA